MCCYDKALSVFVQIIGFRSGKPIAVIETRRRVRLRYKYIL